jgi:YidC/Oxa1 family membrane protein insertase
MLHFLKAILYTPLYNILILLIGIVPGGDVGIAIIVLTLMVKFILYPLTQKSIIVQAKMKAIQPELDRIKAEYPDKQEQAQKTFALYKENNVNPFSSCIVVLIQFPIIIALYYVFLKGLPLMNDTLYSFVHVPAHISMKFLGIVDMQKSSLVLALLAGLTQFFQARLTSMKMTPPKSDGSFKNEMMKSLQLQTQYVLPIFIALIATRIASAVALYWVTSNLFTIGQEFIVRKRAEKQGVLKLKE